MSAIGDFWKQSAIQKDFERAKEQRHRAIQEEKRAILEEQNRAMHKHQGMYVQNSLLGQNGYIQQMAPTPFNPNDEPATMASLETLRDAWAAKWGDAWVEKSAVLLDSFWVHGARRLEAADELELYGGWYRLKETE